MAKYRHDLPQLQHGFFMTDGGLENTLIYLDHRDLPYFAAFLLLPSPEGELELRRYFASYAELACKHDIGVILETATWRACPYWGRILGYGLAELAAENRKAVSLLLDVRQEYESSHTPVVISGCLGSRSDGYVAEERMTVQQAEHFHEFQVHTFADSAADMVTAHALTYADEAIGIARVAKHMHIPVAISFTLAQEGQLPSGELLDNVIRQVDQETEYYPAYYMLSGVLPADFSPPSDAPPTWVQRIHGVRSDALRCRHVVLNGYDGLGEREQVELGQDYAALLRQLTSVNIVGGGCGTDPRYVDRMVASCLPVFLHRNMANR